MSFEWKNYLTLAQDMCGKANGQVVCLEAKYRCAISRAYYSAFCSAKSFIKLNAAMMSDDDKTVHAQVINSFKKQGDNRLCQQIYTDLDRLRTARVKADYHERYLDTRSKTCPNLLSQAIYAISQSESVLNSLKQLEKQVKTG